MNKYLTAFCCILSLFLSSNALADGAGEILSLSNPAIVEDFIVHTTAVYRDARGETLDIQGPGEGVIYMDTAGLFFPPGPILPEGTDRILRVITTNQDNQSITDIAVYNLGGPDEADENLIDFLEGAGLSEEDIDELGELLTLGGYTTPGPDFWDEGLKYETESVLRKPIHITGPTIILSKSNNELVATHVAYDIKPIARMADDGRGVGLRPVVYFTADKAGTVGFGQSLASMDPAEGAGELLIGSIQAMSIPASLLVKLASGDIVLRPEVPENYEQEEDEPAPEGAENEEKSDPADAGKHLFVAGTNQVSLLKNLEPNWQPSNVVFQLDPMFMQIEPAFMTSGEGQGLVVIVATENGQEVVSESVFRSALTAIKKSSLEVTSEGVLVAGTVVTGAALLWKYGRITPVGAFLLGLGFGPAAAADACDRFTGEDGLTFYLSLDIETQLSEASTCPTLAAQVLQISDSLNN